MRTRSLIIGVFLCAAILPAVLAASLYTQARHDPRLWSADDCSPLDNILFAGVILRACSISLVGEGVALAAFVFWQWRLREHIEWAFVLGWAVFFVVATLTAWWLSQMALAAYTQFYDSVPAGAAHDAKAALDLHKQLDKTMGSFLGAGAVFLFMTGTSAVLCGIKAWKFFEVEELDEEIAVHEEQRHHEHPGTTR
jgi:hypothetical protein